MFVQDWQEIVRLYERDSLYLAEAAQILQRLIQYEIPGIRKQMARCDAAIEVRPFCTVPMWRRRRCVGGGT